MDRQILGLSGCPSSYLSMSPFIHLSIYLTKYLSICPSVYLPISPSIHLSIYSSFFLSIYPSIYQSIRIPIYLSIYLPIHLSIHLSFYLSIYLPMYQSSCLCVCLSICLSVYLATCLSIYLFVFWGVLPSFNLSTYLYSIFLSVLIYCPSICLFLESLCSLSICALNYLTFPRRIPVSHKKRLEQLGVFVWELRCCKSIGNVISICLSVYLSICPSVYLSICLPASLKPKLSYETSSSFELDNIKNEAILRNFLNFWTWQGQNQSNSAKLRQFLQLAASKTQPVCEISSTFELDNVKNQAILRDFLNFRSWQHQKRSNSARLPSKMEGWVQSWRPRANAFCDLSIPPI